MHALDSTIGLPGVWVLHKLDFLPVKKHSPTFSLLIEKDTLIITVKHFNQENLQNDTFRSLT
jgi:hypothetical protein